MTTTETIDPDTDWTGGGPRAVALALAATPRLGHPSACRLAADLDLWLPDAGRAPAAELAARAGVPVRAMRRALEMMPEAGRIAAAEAERTARQGVRIVTRFDPEYPPALLDLALPPPVLYVQGVLPADKGIAIVGSRRASGDGREAAAMFARAFSEAGLPVISGFARGIDAAAHRSALDGGSGGTVAVLGCGLDVDYPRGHQALRRAILDGGGALLSELPCGTGPRPWSFPVRNRLIAALSVATLVVQAAPRSGSLITARHALELGREVWAVPGSIFDDRALGPNLLIRDGAAPALHPRDLLELLRLDRPPAAVPAAVELPEGLAGQVIAALPAGAPCPAEAIAARVEASLDRVLGILLELELEGWARREPGPLFRRATGPSG